MSPREAGRRRLVESRVGRVVLMVVGFLVATLIVCAPVGILGSSNLVWGEDNQDGRVDVPGAKVLHLPAGSVNVSAAVDIPGAGNETADLPLPSDLFLSVTPVGGWGRAVIKRDLGASSNANDNLVNTQRRVWSVQVPQDGEYRVTARGDFLGVGVNPQLWLGHGPPLPGTLVPVVAAALVLIGGLFGFIVLLRIRGRLPARAPGSRSRPAAAIEPIERTPSTALPVSHVGASDSSADPLERLGKLGDLHDRGVLTDAEFAAEKAKIISES